MGGENNDVSGWRVAAFLADIVGVIAVGLSAWTAMQLVELKSDVRAIESSRFTAADGLQVWKEISSLRDTCAAADANQREMLARLPLELPPKWFLDSFSEFKHDVTRRLDAIEANQVVLLRGQQQDLDRQLHGNQ